MHTDVRGAVVKITLFQCPCGADALNREQHDGKTRKKPPPHHLEIEDSCCLLRTNSWPWPAQMKLGRQAARSRVAFPPTPTYRDARCNGVAHYWASHTAL